MTTKFTLEKIIRDGNSTLLVEFMLWCKEMGFDDSTLIRAVEKPQQLEKMFQVWFNLDDKQRAGSVQ